MSVVNLTHQICFTAGWDRGQSEHHGAKCQDPQLKDVLFSPQQCQDVAELPQMFSEP